MLYKIGNLLEKIFMRIWPKFSWHLFSKQHNSPGPTWTVIDTKNRGVNRLTGTGMSKMFFQSGFGRLEIGAFTIKTWCFVTDKLLGTSMRYQNVANPKYNVVILILKTKSKGKNLCRISFWNSMCDTFINSHLVVAEFAHAILNSRMIFATL